MPVNDDPLAQSFCTSGPNEILADDFVLVDVMSGSEISKLELLTVVGMGQLRFTKIDVVESRVRSYPGTAVVKIEHP